MHLRLPQPPSPRLGHTLGLLLSACLAALPGTGHSAAPANDVLHQVQPGDTLEALARHYLQAPQQWPLLQAHNAIANPRRLQPGSTLRIPVHLLQTESARVEFVQGTVTATPAGPSPTPMAVQEGSTLTEGTRLQVGDGAFVLVRLADGSTVQVQAQSDLDLQQLRRQGRAGSLQSVIEMRAGRLDATVPKAPEAQRRLEIRTPRAATSVRGTQFGVALSRNGQASTSVLDGSVAVQARQGSPAPATLLAPGQGLAVSPEGQLGTVRTLLPAPDLADLPAVLDDADRIALTLAPQPGAAAYQVQLAPEAHALQVLRNGLFESNRIFLQGLPDGPYRLTVRALDGAGIAGLPAHRALRIKATPIAPLYQSPPPGATVASTGTPLHCTEVPGAAWYHLQLSQLADFSALLRDEPRQPSCQLGTGALPPGVYYWRAGSVRQLANGQPDPGPFAAPQAFTVAVRPATPQPNLDLQAGQHLHWPGQPGDTFRLQCARDLAFTELACDTVLQEPVWSAAGLPAGSYFVRLQTRSPAGLESDFSGARQIHVGAGVQSGTGLGIQSSDGHPLVLHPGSGNAP